MAGELVKAKDVLKIGQRVEFYVGDNEECFASRIEDVTEDELIVAMPVNSKRVPVIPRSNERLYALAGGKQCRYRFFTTFHKTAQIDNRIPVWHIARPDEVERHQNREFVRVRVTMPVQVRLIDEDGAIQDRFQATVVDLSGNGICFALAREVKPGTKAALTLDDIPGVGTIELMSLIVRCTPVERADGTRIYHVGAKFQYLPHAVSNKIVRYLFNVQRSIIAKGIHQKD